MEKTSRKEFIKRGLLYFLYIQAIILVLSVTVVLLNIPIRMLFPKNKDLQSILFCAVGMVCEVLATAFVFRKYQLNNKTDLKDFIKPCIIAYPLHFLLSLINGFYLYTAGIGASEFALYLASIVIGKDVIRQNMPIYFDILVFIPALALKFGGVLLGFYLAKKNGKRD